MGRGPGQQKASSNASQLLFGPRRARNNKAREFNDGQIMLALAALEDDQSAPAIDLLLTFPDKISNGGLLRKLIVNLGQAIRNDRISEGEWKKLIHGLNQHFSADGRGNSFHGLQGALAQRLIEKMTGGTPPGHLTHLDDSERRFMLNFDNLLSNHAVTAWAEAFPTPALEFGLGGAEADDSKRLLARRGVYRTAHLNPDRLDDFIAHSGASPLLSGQVKEDLQNHQGQDLTNAVIDSLRYSGGFRLFGRNNDRPLDDNLLGGLVKATPPAGQWLYKQALSPYQALAVNQARKDLANLSQSLGLNKEAAAELKDEQKRWLDVPEDELAERILAGERGAAIFEQQQRLAKIIAANLSPDNIDKMPVIKDDSKAQEKWKKFKKNYFENSGWGRKRLKVSNQNWQKVIAHALEPIDGNPFNFRFSHDDFLGRLEVVQASDMLEAMRQAAEF